MDWLSGVRVTSVRSHAGQRGTVVVVGRGGERAREKTACREGGDCLVRETSVYTQVYYIIKTHKHTFMYLRDNDEVG